MLTSICIPTHNRRDMLLAALESVLGQDGADFEVIVSDNASADGSADMVSAIRDPRVRLIRQAANIGSVANHNACVSAARGEWILFLHDDDVLIPGGLRLVEEFLSRQERCDIALPQFMAWLLDGRVFDNCLRSLNGISMSSTLYRRDLLVELPFETDNVCCDWELLFSAVLRGRRLCVYPFSYIRRGIHPGQEGTLVALDGRGVAGKCNAMRRLYAQLADEDWMALCHRISNSWNAPELMTLARFVRLAGDRRRFKTYRRQCQVHRKWQWMSKHAVAIYAEHILGPRLLACLLRPWRLWAASRMAVRQTWDKGSGV